MQMDARGWVVTAVAILLTGISKAGLGGALGGPPIMAYLFGRNLPKEAFVASSVFFFTAINLAKLPFYVGIGLFSRNTLLMSAMLVPLVPVGVWLGLRLLRRIPERPFFLFAA